jgi:hypothetical protein
MTTDVIGAFALTALIVFDISAFLSFLALSPSGRLRLGVAVSLWIGLQVALAAGGVFTAAIPLLGLAVVLPPVVALLALARSTTFRAAMLGLPVRLLTGLNIGRVVGGFFVILAAQGRLGGPFPQSAGWGDLLTGLFAIPLTIFAGSLRNRVALGGWNLFGFLDLAAAGVLGILSADGSPVQFIQIGAGSTAVLTLPWVVIPTVLVPFYLTTHVLVFVQLRQPNWRRLSLNPA